VINFLGFDWQPKHITFGLFEPIDTSGQTLVKTLTKLLDSYALKKKNIICVKYEGSNMKIVTTTLKSIVSRNVLGLEESFSGICFGHAFSKTCQYDTTKEKVCKDLCYVSIKVAERDLHKCITWLKKSGKGRQEWE
jgi:hypothetical protein